MNKKIIAYFIILVLLTNFAYANKYFVLDINFVFGSVAVNSYKLSEIDRQITYKDRSGFLFKLVSLEEKDTGTIYINLSEDKIYNNYLIYVPYNQKASRIEIYNQKNSKVADLDLTSFLDTCGNGICESYESYESCKEDCHSGGKDGFCDGVKDGICDPDCLSKLDSDCQESKQNKSIANQPVSNNNKITNTKNEEINI